MSEGYTNNTPSSSKDTILVVEPNTELNNFIYQYLSRDYQVVSAFNGAAGLEKALHTPPQLILTAIQMPGLDAGGMIDEIRRHTVTVNIPVLLLCLPEEEELKFQLLQQQAQDFISKPFDPRELGIRVRNLIAARKYQLNYQDEAIKKQQAAEAIYNQLQSHSRQLSELFEQMPSFIAIVRGPNHIFELANQAYQRLVGFRPIIGKSVREALPEVESQGFPAMLDKVYSTGEPYKGTGVPVFLKKDSGAFTEPHYLNFIYQPLLDDAKNIVGVFIEGHDVTEEVTAKLQLIENEVRLKEQSVWLEQQVRQRTRDLKDLNESLRLSNEDLQQFAHVASHDLKEPIRKIRTFGGRLKDDFEHLLPQQAGVFLEKILTATSRAYSMIDGVLSYSAYVSEDQPKSLVSLDEVLKNIANDLEVLIYEKEATLIVEKLPRLEGYPVLLYQLFYNLVNNSIKFSKKTTASIIRIQSSICDIEGLPFSKITVSDNGIGFAKENSDKIFTTFTRLNSKDKYEGTGLGLALCKKIVQRHGGFIYASGEKNIGAVFTVLLPLN